MVAFFIGIGLLVGLGFLLLLYMWLEAKQSNVIEIHQGIKDLPNNFEGYSIYFLSDIHRRHLSFNMLNRVTQPDLVVIGGDLTEKEVPFERVDQNLQKLKKLGAPIMFIWGNHDLHIDPYRLRTLFKKHGVILISNDTYSVERNGKWLNVVGVHDATNALDCLELALLNVKEGPRILMSHNPEVVKRLRLSHNIPLVVSGHTHGGQIRLFGWGIREKGGVKEEKFGTLIISNGYGTTRYPLRLGARPNTILLKLYCK